MQPYMEYASALLPRLLDLGLDALTAVVILAAGWWVSLLLRRTVRRSLGRSGYLDPTVVPMLATIVSWSVRVVTVIAVLAHFGVQTASLIAVLGAAGLTIGLALQGTLQNIAAGIMLIALRPLRAGEYVAMTSGLEGTVEEVGLFLTRLLRPDGVCVSVPNSSLWNATLINYTRNPQRCFDLPITVHADADLDATLARLRDLATRHPLALSDPAASVTVTQYRDGNLTVNVRVWVLCEHYEALGSDLCRQMRSALAD